MPLKDRLKSFFSFSKKSSPAPLTISAPVLVSSTSSHLIAEPSAQSTNDQIQTEEQSSSAPRMHATASVNGVVIADAENYENVEGNIYFPPSSLKQEYLTETQTHSACPWKGNAHYYTIDIGDGNPLVDAAWFYPVPKPAAAKITGHVAFYKNKVNITTS